MWIRWHLYCWVTFFVLTPAFGEPIGIDTKGLDEVEIQALSKLLSQGACPCDKDKSILACVTDQSCPSAIELAVYGAEKFREGLSALDVQQAVVKKYIQDHVHYTFDLKNAPVKGATEAKITVVEFADFQCGHCARLSESIDVLKAEFGDQVRFVFKQFPMTRHPFAHYAARASLAAHNQGAFWQFHDLLFKHQFQLSEAKIDGFASELKLDMKKYTVDREHPEIYAQIARDRKEAIAAGLRATPTLYINGRLYTESKSLDSLRKTLKNALTAQ
ncbi:MAG: DsbA family protein [Bradymonadia bacterium]